MSGNTHIYTHTYIHQICQRFVEMLWACQVDKRKKAAGSGDSSPKDDGKIPTQVMPLPPCPPTMPPNPFSLDR